MRKAEPAGNLRASHFCFECIRLRRNMSVKQSYSVIREILKTVTVDSFEHFAIYRELVYCEECCIEKSVTKQSNDMSLINTE